MRLQSLNPNLTVSSFMKLFQLSFVQNCYSYLLKTRVLLLSGPSEPALEPWLATFLSTCNTSYLANRPVSFSASFAISCAVPLVATSLASKVTCGSHPFNLRLWGDFGLLTFSKMEAYQSTFEPICVVCMALRLPGRVQAKKAFWELFVDKTVSGFCKVPEDRYTIECFYNEESEIATRVTV